jgi:hypothetical protein
MKFLPILCPFAVSAESSRARELTFRHRTILLALAASAKVQSSQQNSVREFGHRAQSSPKDSAKDNAHVRPASRCNHLIRRKRGPDLLSRFCH